MRTADTILADVARVCKLKDPGLILVQSTDPLIIQARQLAAYLLSDLWKDPDEGRVQSRLKCSRAFIQQAKSLVNADDANGVVFRSRMSLIGGTEECEPAVSAPAFASAPEPSVDHADTPHIEDVSPKELLQRGAGAVFKEGQELEARRAIACVASKCFSMDTDEIAGVLDSDKRTARRMLVDGTYDYEFDAAFKGQVDRMCVNMGIRIS